MSRKAKRDDDIEKVVQQEQMDRGCTTVGTICDDWHWPRASMKVLFDAKQVLKNGHKVHPQDKVVAGDVLCLQMVKEKIDYEPVAMDLVIVYEDEDLLILNKSLGMTVNSKGQTSIANGVAHYFKEQGIKRKVRFLNRLDRDTSGLLVIAKSGFAQSLYQQQLENHTFEKWYKAQVLGRLEGQGMWELLMRRSQDGQSYEVVPELLVNSKYPIKNTKTWYKALQTMKLFNGQEVTEVEVRLYTGKTHQIRVAMAYKGHPLVGDALYGGQVEGLAQDTYHLCADWIAFTHIRTHKRVEVRL